MRPTTHRLERNIGALPAVIKVYGELTKKAQGHTNMKQLPTLATSIPNPHKDHLAVVIPMKLSGRVYDHYFVLLLPYYYNNKKN